MIVVRGPQGAHDRNVVDAPPHMGHPVAKFDPAVAVFSKANLQRVKFLPQLDVEGDFAAV